jgi:mono/diheme cytochrome c family protein
MFLSILGMMACSQQDSTLNINANRTRRGTPAPVATVDELASGKKVYETNCMICHNDNGTGGKLRIEGKSLKVEDLTAEKIRKMSNEKIILTVMNGIEDEGMPAFKGKISEGELRDLVKYIRTQFHKSSPEAY